MPDGDTLVDADDQLRKLGLAMSRSRCFPLTDVATITRGYADPPITLFRFNGQPAIALAIGMRSGANLAAFISREISLLFDFSFT